MKNLEDGISYIYALVHPNTLEIKYIGKTEKTLKERLHQHMLKAKRKDKTYHVCNWIRSLLKQGLKPSIEIVEMNPIDLNKSEIEWISQFKAWGYNLANHTYGGEGKKGRGWSDEARVRVYKNHGGRPIIDNLGNRYETCSEVIQKLNITSSSLLNILKNKMYFWHGMTFWYEGEPPKKVPLAQKHGPRVGEGKWCKPFSDQTGKTFNSVGQACDELTLHKAAVLKVLQGKQKHTGGYIFNYIGNLSG